MLRKKQSSVLKGQGREMFITNPCTVICVKHEGVKNVDQSNQVVIKFLLVGNNGYSSIIRWIKICLES